MKQQEKEACVSRPNPLEAVLFDFDGVCVDTEPLGIELDREVYAQYGIEPTDEELLAMVGTTGEQTIPWVFSRHGMEVSAEEFWARRRDNSLIYREMDLVPMPGIVEALTSMRLRGVRCALVSTTSSANINFALDRLEMQRLFDILVCGDMVARHKPEPDPYQLAVALLGCDPARCMAVEDSPTGIASAKAAGLYTVGFAGLTIHQDTSAADETVQSLLEL